MRRLALPLTFLALAALLTAGAAPADPPFTGDDPHVRTENLSWVANVQYPVVDGNTRTARADTQGGTDLELATLTVADGDGGFEERDYSFAGSYENGFHVIDVTDPEAPVRVATYDCNLYQGDVQVFQRQDLVTPDGRPRTFVTFTADYTAKTASTCYQDLPSKLMWVPSGGLGTFILEVTDPTDPRAVSFAPISVGSHNMTVHPSGMWLYNSDNDAAAQLEVWDISDVDAPRHAHTMTLQEGSSDAHDVTFDETGDRAYVASITHSYILDTSDPVAPTVISTIVDPAISIHHQADPYTVEDPVLGERTYLIISDEVAGAAGNGYCPGGGLHVYDITVEAAPVKLGAYFMPDVFVQEGATTGTGGTITCTAHVFRIYPEQQVMTISQYSGGVRVLDLSQLVGVSAGPRPGVSTGQVAGISDLGSLRFTTTHDTWASKAHPDRFEDDGSFHFFSNDQTRGFEVFRFDASAPTSVEGETGRWETPAGAVQRAQQLDLRLGPERALRPICALPGPGLAAGAGP